MGEDVKIIEKRRHTDKRETLSNPSLHKALGPVSPEGAVWIAGLGPVPRFQVGVSSDGGLDITVSPS